MSTDPTPVAEGSYGWYRREVERLRAALDTAGSRTGGILRQLDDVEAERDALKAAVHQVFDCWADPFGNWTAEQATAARAQKSQMLQRLLAALDAPSTEGAVEDGPEVLRLAAGAEADLADEFKAGLDAYKASDARVRALCEQAIQSAARSVGAMSVSAMSGEPVQATVRVVDVLAALDTPTAPESPERPRHIGGRANAEDCPGCAGLDLPYPWICPGEPESPEGEETNDG